MFRGEYNFFDYKYNIAGYSGQDFGGIAQYIYLIFSFILIIILLIYYRKADKDKILKKIREISIFLVLFYLAKTTWETIYDIALFNSFNTGLLPLDACSIIMFSGLISSFSKGKIKEYADAWLVTGGIIGGLATMLYLNAFKFYPFLSFGAFYSMIWHFLMVFLGLLLIVTKYAPISYKTIIKGFLFHLGFSCIVIPLDYIFDWDFMMYKNLGSIPIFEDIASSFTAKGLNFLNPVMMLLLYFLAFNLIYVIYFGIKYFIKKIKKS